MPASLDLPTLLPKVPNRLHQQQLHYYFPAVHASVDPDSSSHKILLQKNQYVTLSFITRTGDTGAKSGLNWGQRKNKNRTAAQNATSALGTIIPTRVTGKPMDMPFPVPIRGGCLISRSP